MKKTTQTQKHTPGPWNITGTSKSLQRYHVAGANGENLCAVFTSIPECEANAKLIASAPQLKAENEQLKASNKELRQALEGLSKLVTMSDMAFSAANVNAKKALKQTA